MRENIKKYAETALSNNEIAGELQECEQFHKELSMINQFSGQPLDMQPPNFCFSQLTYPLVVRLNQSYNFWNVIETFCLGNELLFEFIKELYHFLVKNISFNVE